MKFGPVPPKKLPEQDPTRVLLLAERWQRAAFAHQKWAEPAKEAVDFFEGRHYTADQIATLKRQGRPHFRFNVIKPIVRTVLGYQKNNKTDISFEPGNDGLATDDVSEALTQLEKAIAHDSGMEFVDGEVFLDGLICGRGWYDTQLDWDNNDFGEAKTSSKDPFQIFVDPDASTYDLNESAAFLTESEWVSIDEIEASLGKNIAELVRPWSMGQTPLAPISGLVVADEITPVRFFGQREDASVWWDQFYSMMGDFYDTARKSIRVLNTQHKVREPRNVVIDLETGDTKVLPETVTVEQIAKMQWWCEQQGNPIAVQKRVVERIQWTTQCADLILYDAPSMYDGYTLTGYFPYFRRGVTQGMVEDLIDPQKEKNKSRNARIEIESKTANGGWIYGDDAFDPAEEAKLKQFGSTPGVNVKYRKDAKEKPALIQASQPAIAYERLERQSDEDIRKISGVNEAALGEEDSRATSGRAILARQQQAVVAVQGFMDNLKRSKRIVGRAHLDIIQRYYTEHRIYRVTGEDGKKLPVEINMKILDGSGVATRIVNDVTVGKYVAQVSDVPMSATFQSAQFEEAMTLLEKLGPALGPMMPVLIDLVIGMSSVPRKDEWIERIQAMNGLALPPPGGGAPVPPGGGQPVPTQGPEQLAPPSNVVPLRG